MNLTEHFTLQEMCKSDTAIRNGVNNTPDDDQIIANLTGVCRHILEPVREKYGVPFTPSSGYRSSALNKMIGGSTTSQHSKGQAADFEVPTVDNLELATWVMENLTFDQLILEYYKSGDPASGWIHASFCLPDQGETRGDVMTFDGNTYMTGLIP
jgi:zinc D-Ala-D-Ala carboxypeptidase